MACRHPDTERCDYCPAEVERTEKPGPPVSKQRGREWVREIKRRIAEGER